MMATGTPRCPVAAYKLYIQKLNPKYRWLFQRPKAITPPNGTWFDNMVLGVKSLEKMMKRISEDAGLSKLYTNHCIRATCITILDQNNTEAHHILSVTGQSSEMSLRSYAKTSTLKRQQMSSLIASKSSSATSSTSRHSEQSTTSSTLVERQQLLGNRPDTSSFAPTANFDLLSGIFSDPDTEPSGSLMLESRQHHGNHLVSAFREGTVNNNCTINVNPVIINLVVYNKRKCVVIESNSSQEY